MSSIPGSGRLWWGISVRKWGNTVSGGSLQPYTHSQTGGVAALEDRSCQSRCHASCGNEAYDWIRMKGKSMSPLYCFAAMIGVHLEGSITVNQYKVFRTNHVCHDGCGLFPRWRWTIPGVQDRTEGITAMVYTIIKSQPSWTPMGDFEATCSNKDLWTPRDQIEDSPSICPQLVVFMPFMGGEGANSENSRAIPCWSPDHLVPMNLEKKKITHKQIVKFCITEFLAPPQIPHYHLTFDRFAIDWADCGRQVFWQQEPINS